MSSLRRVLGLSKNTVSKSRLFYRKPHPCYNLCMLTIISAPNPMLSGQAKPVRKITKDIQKLIEEMKETLVNTSDPEGVGLAAPQIGKDLQLFIIKEDV